MKARNERRGHSVDPAVSRPRERPPIGARVEIGLGASAASRAAASLGIVLVVLTLARAIFSFVPSMWAWSINLQRFLPTVTGGALWALAALALIPAIVRPIVPAVSRAGDEITRSRLAPVVVAALAALLVGLVPDRLFFVGDFLMRQGAVESVRDPRPIFSQALPLDLWLHYSLPLRLVRTGWVDANGAARLIGAIEAALLALLAVRFSRVLALEGAAAATGSAIVFFGGYLGLFTGYSKAFVELCVLVGALAVFGLRVIREGRDLALFGIALALSFLLHRSALALIPAAATVWILWLRRHARPGAWRSPAAIVGIGLPVIALATMLPRVIETILHFDLSAHVAPAFNPGGSHWSIASTGTRMVDILNLIVLLCPLALAIPVLLVVLGRRARSAELALLSSLVIPLIALMIVIQPQHGLYRDWDVHAPAGVALALMVAWLVAETLAAGEARSLAPAIVLAVAMPCAQWLLHQTDVERGFARIEAFLTESPARPDAERLSAWEFLGARNFRLERWDPAIAAFEQAARISPSPSILTEWATAAYRSGKLESAQRAFQMMLVRRPNDVDLWRSLATVSMRRGDVATLRRAVTEVLARDSTDAQARQILEGLPR